MRRERILTWAMAATMTLWVAHVIHGAVDGQGVVGWVTDLAVQRLGSASDTLCFAAAALVGMIPIGLVFRLIAWRLGVRLVRRRGELPAGTPSQIRARAVLGAMGFALAGGLLMLLAMPREDGVPRRSLDLDAPGAALPPDGSLVAVSGTVHHQDAAGYRETTSHGSTIYRFIPITSASWTPGQPVQFFLAEVERSGEDSKGIVVVPGPNELTRYQGRLRRNAMATLARGALERHGVRIAEPYWVIRNDREELMMRAVMIGGLGLVLALALILTGWRHARAVADRDARRRPPPPPGPPLPLLALRRRHQIGRAHV